MKQGGGTIDTNALANGRGLSTGSPSVAPVWNSTATVKTSTPTSYIPSYTSWYPTAHQDTMQQPQLMWIRTATTTPPIYSHQWPSSGDPTQAGHSAALHNPDSPDQTWPGGDTRKKTPANTQLGQGELKEGRLQRRGMMMTLFLNEGNAGKVGQIKAATLPFSATFCCVKNTRNCKKFI